MSLAEGPSPIAAAGRDGDDATGKIWYRRRSVLVTLLVCAVALITVISDLPEHASRPAQISSGTSVVRELNADVAPCSFAVGEAYTIYRDERSSRLSQSDRTRVPSLLRDDQAACSFTDESIFNLSNIEVPGSVAGRHLQELVSTVTLWATSDGVAAIEAVQTVFAHPRDQAAQRRLKRATSELAADRHRAMAEIAAADQVLAAQLPAVDLPGATTS